MGEMFCFQCQQTAHNNGCDGKAGVCGKKADNANLQDELTGVIIGIARIAEKVKPSESTTKAIVEGLFTTITNVDFDIKVIHQFIDKVKAEKKKILSICTAEGMLCDEYEDYDMKMLWNDNENIRSLKSLILFGLRGMAAYYYHALILGYTDKEVESFFYKGLFMVGKKDVTVEELLPVVLKTGKANFDCMKLLDKAHTETFGNPVPTNVPLTIEKGPFIVISGHDLHDLKLLLEQTEGKGINIYTHGEMLPAHGYPELKKYKHLKGNFGTAWQYQQTEFHNIPGPVLFTTNCIMPVRQSYSDRIFTTSVVAYPEMIHIGEDKNFAPIIKKAIECRGYDQDEPLTGINKGSTVTTGFGHTAVLSLANELIDAIKSKKIRHIFLVGGCDGAAPSRNYYTEFVKQTPSDTIVLTLACGKYRFNDLKLPDVAGFPKILDVGQCNDAYSAIVIALALAEAFGCEINQLPLTLVLSWYEQKAVAILLTLLHFGIKNMYLGPTLPAFLSNDIVKYLQDNFSLHAISTPEKDLKAILG